MRLSEHVGHFVGQALHDAPKTIAISLAGVPGAFHKACGVAAMKGVLTPSCADGVNLVNAPVLARLRGVTVTETSRNDADGYANVVKVTVSSAHGERSASGTLFGDRHGRMVAVDGLPLEFSPEGSLLVITNRDVPGVVGRIGTLLGERNVNISDFALARGKDSRAAAVVRIDRLDGAPIGKELLDSVASLAGIESARLVTLS
jgi:D-3-phosphoglycerate dehydrogenase